MDYHARPLPFGKFDSQSEVDQLALYEAIVETFRHSCDEARESGEAVAHNAARALLESSGDTEATRLALRFVTLVHEKSVNTPDDVYLVRLFLTMVQTVEDVLAIRDGTVADESDRIRRGPDYW
ncbi:MAG: hypothetical protein KDB14_20705 [Planctomycetales bacterium]|nr:hypothetical protein [Planctomycetales bacterium]